MQGINRKASPNLGEAIGRFDPMNTIEGEIKEIKDISSKSLLPKEE